MKGWEINVLSVMENDEVGVCPDCGSSNIDMEKIILDRHIGIFFRCRQCGSMDHFDGILPEK